MILVYMSKLRTDILRVTDEAHICFMLQMRTGVVNNTK